MSRNHFVFIIVFLIGTLIASGVQAETNEVRDRAWQLRFGPVFVDGNGSTTLSASTDGLQVGGDLSSGGGGGISLERRINPRFGVELGLAGAGLDFGFRTGVGDGDVSTSTDLLVFTPLTIGANFHLVPEGPVDVYVGPMLVWARYSELEVRTDVDGWPWWPFGTDNAPVAAVTWKSDSELTWGSRLGAGFTFGTRGRWSLETALSFIDATFSARRGSGTEITSVDLDPVIFSVGAGFRF
jgi:outer membrane protein W